MWKRNETEEAILKKVNELLTCAVRLTYSSIHTISDNADRIEESAESGR